MYAINQVQMKPYVKVTFCNTGFVVQLGLLSQNYRKGIQ